MRDIFAKLFGEDAAANVADGFYSVFIIVVVLLLIAGFARAFGNRGRKGRKK